MFVSGSDKACRGQVDVEQVRLRLRCSAKRVTESMHELMDAGIVQAKYTLGVIDYRVILRCAKRSRDLGAEAIEALLSLPPAAVKAYFAIASHGATCWPSKTRIAEFCKRTTRTVERAIRDLVENGLLVVNKIPWWKIRGYRWRHGRKRIAVLTTVGSAPREPLKMSRNSSDLCRVVTEEILNQQGFPLRGRIAIVPQDTAQNLPLPPHSQAPKDETLARSLLDAGLTDAQARWVSGLWPAHIVRVVLQRVSSRWTAIKDRRAYIIGTLRRHGQTLRQ